MRRMQPGRHVNDPRMELLERDAELALLGRAVDEATEARGRMVLVEGPPGIGKTRLIESARAAAHERGMRVLSARASELDRQFPFGVVRQLFEPLVAAAEPSRRATLLRGQARLAAPLLDAAAAEPDARTEDRSLANFHALYWLAANL